MSFDKQKHYSYKHKRQYAVVKITQSRIYEKAENAVLFFDYIHIHKVSEHGKAYVNTRVVNNIEVVEIRHKEQQRHIHLFFVESNLIAAL